MNKSDITLVIITGNSLRHYYFAKQLINNFNVLGVILEEKRKIPGSISIEEQKVINLHIMERKAKEVEYFPKDEEVGIDKNQLVEVGYGETNAPFVKNMITSLSPDYVIIYGCSIIEDEILNCFESRVINMHLGLSPYYRGAATNFWPLVNCEPECVGVTVHLATLNVDAGKILGQNRPEISEEDGPHDIGCKAIIAGTKLMIKCIRGYKEKTILPEPQKAGGRLYKNKDFEATYVEQMYKNFKNGMIEKYLNNLSERIKPFKIKTV